jgi:hypothetical protein
MVAACGRPSPPAPEVLQAEIEAARDRVWRAWFGGDSAGLVAALPERMVAMDETVAEIIANSRAFHAAGNRLVELSFSDSEFVLSDTIAVVISTYRAETVRNDTAGVMTGRATELFVREGGVWKNPHWHLHVPEDSTGG